MTFHGIFSWKQHYITIVGESYSKKVLLKTKKQLKNLYAKQKPNENIFITKYPINRKVNMIILDFDSSNVFNAWKEVNILYNYLKSKNINSVIVDSSNKGYHLYIQIPTLNFFSEDKKYFNNLFNLFIYNLIEYKYETLDPINTHAGLNGNIRLINSIHPKTGKRVEIVKGNFIKNDKKYYNNTIDFINQKYNEAIKYQELKKQEIKINIQSIEKSDDIIASNDLRQLFPKIFNTSFKRFNDYIVIQCPFHNDNNPSMQVTKDWYYCWGCGAKGNIWSLIKQKIIKYDDVS